MARRFPRIVSSAAALALVLLLAACGPPAKVDILKKSANAKTKEDLEQALGKPSDVEKLGPLEKWTYRASDGSVVFLITGDTVAIEATGGSK